MGLVKWQDPFHYQKQSSRLAFNRLSRQQQDWQTQMQQYLRTKQCRWRFLLNAFGFTHEANGMNCGHCDRCNE